MAEAASRYHQTNLSQAYAGTKLISLHTHTHLLQHVLLSLCTLPRGGQLLMQDSKLSLLCAKEHVETS